MNPILFKVVHLVGLMGLFLSFGAMFLGSPNKKAASILHGVSLLLLALAGFALLGKPPEQSWWIIKLVIWLFLGAAPVLAKRKVLPAPALIVISVGAAGFAAWLGLAKPF